MSHLYGTIDEFANTFKDMDLQGKTLLDVGCRNVDARERLENLGLKWTGCDKVPEKNSPDVLKMDMTELTFPDNSFDFIFVCHSLEHCDNPIKAIKEFKRVVKEGGFVFISLPCHCQHHILESDEDHIFCFTDMQIKRILTYCNYQDINVFDCPQVSSMHCQVVLALNVQVRRMR